MDHLGPLLILLLLQMHSSGSREAEKGTREGERREERVGELKKKKSNRWEREERRETGERREWGG